ncbi:leucine-rich repeat-containing protein 20-like isoform X2 [Arctopsyche grandis]|uniref:leucine-rich repeat-containing protein 20-like isoform X2 n=1 Tax=Arctopsyche grandis TaxID=121162 RepID=UPI00406D93E1
MLSYDSALLAFEMYYDQEFKNKIKMASAVARVILKCEEAEETKVLDLSDCQLMQVPDAVYHLLRHTELQTCDLSGNVITKIPPKFADKFNLITDLNLSHNQMSRLPDELVSLRALQRLDISHNSFVSLPRPATQAPSLITLNASHNHIIDVDIELVVNSPSLRRLDLTNNPLGPNCHSKLKALPRPSVTVSEREVEDWEDLTI